MILTIWYSHKLVSEHPHYHLPPPSPSSERSLMKRFFHSHPQILSNIDSSFSELTHNSLPKEHLLTWKFTNFLLSFCSTYSLWVGRVNAVSDHTRWDPSARRRDLYLTTHNTHNRHTSMPPVGFEPTIPASEWPQTYALDRAVTRLSTVHHSQA